MITVLGLGFVGLTTALGFSEKGYDVYGFDVNSERTATLKKGTIPFHEPHLTQALHKHLAKRFHIVDDLKEAIEKSSVIFFCVGTPAQKNGESDLSYLKEAIAHSLRFMPKGAKKPKTFIIKSSVPPSTAREQIKPFIEQQGFKIGKALLLANNPEFLREGFAWEDFIKPDRIIIGADETEGGKIAANIYRPFKAPIVIVSLTTAEFIKYLSNSLLAAMISFSNEMSLAAYAIGDIDIPKAFKVLHLDKRWFGNPANMASYAYPGCGFGGYCLPKDVEAMQFASSSHGYEASLLKEVMRVNRDIKAYVADTIAQNAKKTDTIGILGLSFKTNSDDVRETPAKDIISKLVKKGFGNIIGYDPLAIENFKNAYHLPIAYSGNLQDVIKASRHLVILTAWKEFRTHENAIRKKNVFDFRYMLSS